MKRIYLYIVLLGLALALYSCAGESKSSDNVAAETTESAKEMTEEVTEEESAETESVSSNFLRVLEINQLEAYQTRAIQKFKDFNDYLNIISDSEVDQALKEHSIEMALELFSNDSTTIPTTVINLDEDSVEINTTSLKEFLNALPSANGPNIHINTKSIQFTTALIVDSTSSYQGKMNATITINNNESTKIINVHLVEIEKMFGDSIQTIMEVRLGNIY